MSDKNKDLRCKPPRYCICLLNSKIDEYRPQPLSPADIQMMLVMMPWFSEKNPETKSNSLKFSSWLGHLEILWDQASHFALPYISSLPIT